MSVHYAELHALSSFSFRQSVAQPHRLVEQAKALGYRAIAITDEVSLAGAVRAHEAAQRVGIQLIIGSTVHWLDEALPGPMELVLLAPNQEAYSQLCRLISQARQRAPKGQYALCVEDLDLDLSALLVIWKAHPLTPDRDHQAIGQWLYERFKQHLWIGATRTLGDQDGLWRQRLEQLSQSLNRPIVACGDVRMPSRDHKPLLDVLYALQHRTTIDQCGLKLESNAERHLRPLINLEKLYPRAWLDETLRIAKRCTFSMNQLSYQYPKELVPDGKTAIEHLTTLTKQGLKTRYGDHPSPKVEALIQHELTLIEEMGVEAFFLTVHDLVYFARQRGILCQGRGSAANSAVCYCLGITEVDPAKQSLLFERFISKERDEPPDIDVDFEHERREEVLQYIYQKYGRQRAALAATVITYRPKSALKDVGRALGFQADTLNQLTHSLAWWDQPDQWPTRLSQCGIDPQAPRSQWLLDLTRQLIGLPRHLSQHVGGMVISDQPLYQLVPIENAAMDERTIIQWDKDDLETLGLLKVDCLALGILSVLRKALHLIKPHSQLSDIPKEDPKTYDMLCRADAIGVFQVESRAQMAMLPRLKPRCFYDLVIEVAIVRPGPIQGDMVHPYLKRRQNSSQINYPSPALEGVLERTLGVPIFQEQVMQIAMVAAGFSPGQADQLRRAMAAWKRSGGLEPFKEPLIEGMLNNGYQRAFAEKIYAQIQGFGDYGFPESHAASFALLTYFSAWIKCHHPAAFACALLNSQPMGFYAPAQIIHDAQRHQVMIEAVDVCTSDWDCQLIDEAPHPGAIRLGFNQVKGLSIHTIERLIGERSKSPFQSIEALTARVRVPQHELKALAKAGALATLSPDRRKTHWTLLAAPKQCDLLSSLPHQDTPLHLNQTPLIQQVAEDYESLGYSLNEHPIALLRPTLDVLTRRSNELHQAHLEPQTTVQVLGLVTHRQRPGTASGVIFISLEDETGLINVIVWPKVAQQYHLAILQAQALRVEGRLQQRDGSIHVIAQSIQSEDAGLLELISSAC